jgi:hypothetical protein
LAVREYMLNRSAKRRRCAPCVAATQQKNDAMRIARRAVLVHIDRRMLLDQKRCKEFGSTVTNLRAWRMDVTGKLATASSLPSPS